MPSLSSVCKHSAGVNSSHHRVSSQALEDILRSFYSTSLCVKDQIFLNIFRGWCGVGGGMHSEYSVVSKPDST